MNKITAFFAFLISGLATPLFALAEETTAAQSPTPWGNNFDLLRYALAGIFVLLLCVIAVLANAAAGAGKLFWERNSKPKSSGTAKMLLVLIAISFGSSLHAEEIHAAATTSTTGLPGDIVFMLIMISLEFIIILVLARMLLQFLSTKTAVHKKRKKVNFQELFQKLNQTVALEDEEKLDLQHNYDGIRELDNKIPAWWQYAFIATMIFGVIYLYRMFVTETLPDQFQELTAANEIAAIQKEEYLKNAANNIDENNVVMLDASGIAGGHDLFIKNCQACHGDAGQGGVGPNLTDDYWLHKGSIKDVFFSIKYGWPEKGMKSWKEDFSPAQIAQLASFVKSLHGTKPAGGKEPQGALYAEEAAPAQDTATIKAN